MTTSSTTIFELSRDSIIAAAMRKIGALAKGQSPDSEDLTNGMQALNAIIAGYATLGMTVWKNTTIAVTPVASQTDYQIGIGKTTNSAFPMRVEHVYVKTTADGTRVELESEIRERFDKLNSSTTGKPNQYSYQPKINFGILSVWPTFDTTNAALCTIQVYGKQMFEGFTAANETPDFPQEWQNALIYGLACSLAPEYGVPLKDRELLNKEYGMHLDLATAGGDQDNSIFFQVDTDGLH